MGPEENAVAGKVAEAPTASCRVAAPGSTATLKYGVALGPMGLQGSPPSAAALTDHILWTRYDLPPAVAVNQFCGACCDGPMGSSHMSPISPPGNTSSHA